MGEEKHEEIKVTDRRHFYADGTLRADVSAEDPAVTPPPPSISEASPETDAAPPPQAETPVVPPFLGFLMELRISAAVHLGLMPSPASDQIEVNLQAAKEIIDLLGLLEEKTRGNLTAEEEQFLRHSLTEFRLTYVKKVGSAPR